MFRIFLSQTPCVICRDFRSEFNTARVFALISPSRFYTKRCSQIATFGELTRHLGGRKFKPRVVGLLDQPPTEISLQVGQMPLLTQECHMRRSPSSLGVTSSPSARLGAKSFGSPSTKRLAAYSHHFNQEHRVPGPASVTLQAQVTPLTEARP